jgi:hypothetical protein
MKAINGDHTPFLYHSVDGKVVSKTLCTSNPHANQIIIDLMLKLDPFHKWGCVVKAVYEDRISFHNPTNPNRDWVST